MTTIGDSFAVVAVLIGIGLTLWAMILSFSLLFVRRAAQSREELENHPWRSLLVGGLVGGFLGVISLGLVNAPLQLAKVAGTVGLFGLICLAAMGAGGLAILVSGRIRAMDPGQNAYSSLSRATMLIVVGSFFPLVGWFFVGPILFALSLGAGLSALFRREVTAPTWEIR